MFRSIGFVGISVIVSLALAGCTPQQHAEYAVFSTVNSLAEASTDVVTVKIGESRAETLHSQKFEGDDPETNPYLGSDESELPTEDESAVDVIVFTGVVVVSHLGTYSRGDEIQIHQLPNEADGVPLESGETYVLFLVSAEGYPSGIEGGTQGQFLVTDSGYVAADTVNPLKLTDDDLEKLALVR